MDELRGKVAFITGGGSGIGFAQAKAFAREGMKVAIVDVRQDHLDTAREWFDRERLTLHAKRLDVTDRVAYCEVADEVEKVLGPVQLLCNTAGVVQLGPIQEATYADWDWLLSVNLGGVINGIQTFIPRMVRRGLQGHVVNTASMAALTAVGGFGIYCTSKFAVRGLTECLRQDLAPLGIGVSLLCPGGVNTNIHEAGLTRPQKYADSGYDTDARGSIDLKAAVSAGMDPDELVTPVLRAVRENLLWVLPFPEFREQLDGIHRSIMAALAKPEDDPGMQERVRAEGVAMQRVMERLAR